MCCGKTKLLGSLSTEPPRSPACQRTSYASDFALPQVSKPRRAKAIKVEADKLTISSTCGYRSAQSSRGTHSGTWYFEINVVHLGDTGHCRLGIGTQKQEIEAPCGYTDASYGYRDTDGSKVHKSLRQPYAAGFREGDTVGCAQCAMLSLHTCISGVPARRTKHLHCDPDFTRAAQKDDTGVRIRLLPKAKA